MTAVWVIINFQQWKVKAYNALLKNPRKRDQKDHDILGGHHQRLRWIDTGTRFDNDISTQQIKHIYYFNVIQANTPGSQTLQSRTQQRVHQWRKAEGHREPFLKKTPMSSISNIRCVHCNAPSLKSDTSYEHKNILCTYMWAHYIKVLSLIRGGNIGYAYTSL